MYNRKLVHLEACYIYLHPQTFCLQVGVAVIAWEYERQRKKDIDKKAKEEAFRQQVDDLYAKEKQVN